MSTQEFSQGGFQQTGFSQGGFTENPQNKGFQPTEYIIKAQAFDELTNAVKERNLEKALNLLKSWEFNPSIVRPNTGNISSSNIGNQGYQPPTQQTDYANKGYQPPTQQTDYANKGYQPLTQQTDYANKGYQPPTQQTDFENKGYQPPTQQTDFENKGFQG